jgi:2-polyprenyl-3-methyl-5-hydroxy-6-metoxy-1,4-benzoquinol methylase
VGKKRINKLKEYSADRACPVCECKTAKYIATVNTHNIVRCQKCNMVFADILNTVIEQKNVYTDSSFYGYIENEPIFSLAYYDIVLEKIVKHFKTNKLKILEFGCGAGFFLRRARHKGLDAYGSDFSPYAKKSKQVFNLNIEIENIFNTTYPEKYFDVIYTHATHEHLGDMTAITRKLLSLLKNDGLLIISGVPNFNNILIRLFNNYFKNKPPSHVNFFEKKSINTFFNSLGLKTFSIKTYGMNMSMLYFYLKAKSANKAKVQSTYPTEALKINTSDLEIKTRHKFIARIYAGLNLPNMGWNIEAWAKKIINEN